jgi:multisubunit Na+/H+ antiporter MnhG subunit
MDDMTKWERPPGKKELMAFNLIFAVIFLAVSLLPLIKGGGIRTWSITVSLALFVIAVTYPRATIGFYRVWIKFGGFIGRVNSKIILGLLFYLVITPIGLIFRLLGKDILHKKMDKNKSSYYEDRHVQPGSMKNQF